MKKKLLIISLLFFTFLSLCGCGEVVVEPPVVNPGGTSTNPGNDPDPDTIDEEYTVCLYYYEKVNKVIYIPKKDEVINVYWRNEYTQYSAQIDSTGYAKMKLDGDFNVYIDNVPSVFVEKGVDYTTYNPNINHASIDEKNVEIELVSINRPKGSGTSEYNCINIKPANKNFEVGYYRTEIKSKTSKVFYEFEPPKNGYYYIESIINMYDDTINPNVETYRGTVASKYPSQIIDGGGISQTTSYTQNFRWVVQLTEDEVGNTFTFAVMADVLEDKYPVNIDFQIIYVGEKIGDPTLSKIIEAKEANFKTPEYDTNEYQYINSNGGKGSYYSGSLNGSTILDGSNFKYNEETGYYHVYDKATKTFGPILCAKIAEPCAYYESALNVIELAGNKALTVSNGTENYKQFIEIEYTACCNSDGVCYVTQELKDFLQKFSIAERLFADGNGFVEYAGVYASEEDQWLFACGYYQKK